jgi:hypothetical protein
MSSAPIQAIPCQVLARTCGTIATIAIQPMSMWVTAEATAEHSTAKLLKITPATMQPISIAAIGSLTIIFVTGDT